jgi:hypothetical protein
MLQPDSVPSLLTSQQQMNPRFIRSLRKLKVSGSENSGVASRVEETIVYSTTGSADSTISTGIAAFKLGLFGNKPFGVC